MKRISQVVFITLLVALYPNIEAWSQKSTRALLDSFYSEQDYDRQFTGNILITSDDKAIYRKAIGHLNVDKLIMNTDSSAFALASITQVLTATAILQLKEKDLLQLDDRYIKYFPDFPYPAITIRQLLAHTSGLPGYELFDSLITALPEKILRNTDVIPALKLWHKSLRNEPGEGWYYSSVNYLLLALLTEKLSSMTLEDYFSKYLFIPAGMYSSYLESNLAVKKNVHRTVNYDVAGNTTQPTEIHTILPIRKMVYNCGGLLGHDGLTSTTWDMEKFDKAYFSGKLISRKSMEEAMTSIILKSGTPVVSGTLLGGGIAGFGLGWFIGVHPMLGTLVWHAGRKPGVTAVYLHAVTANQTVFIFQNMRNKTKAEQLAFTTMSIINGLP